MPEFLANGFCAAKGKVGTEPVLEAASSSISPDPLGSGARFLLLMNRPRSQLWSLLPSASGIPIGRGARASTRSRTGDFTRKDRRSALYRAQRVRAVPALGGGADHGEDVAQALAVDMDLQVVAQDGGGVVEGVVDFAGASAQVLR